MPEMHLRQRVFVFVNHLQKTKQEYKNLKKQGIHSKIIKKKLHKACFQHDMAYWDLKDLTRRTAFDEILHDKAFYIAKNLKYVGYQRRLASMVYTFFDKKTSGGTVKKENISNKELAEALHKPIIGKFKKQKVHSLFIDNILGADLADMQLISKFKKGFRFLYVTDIYNKYAWVISFKDKKGITINNAFQKNFKRI